MPRHMTSLNIDLVIDYPEDMERNPDHPEVQDFLRELFVDYLQSAQFIELGFVIDDEEEEE